ncbi:MAG TPA: cytochrome c [Bryobacteraceae bacterium]|nr:cytochrome c [Bryobacteraceae bacterium]
MRILSIAPAALLAASSILLVGCAGSMSRNPAVEVFPDMDRQGKYKPQTESALFGDKRGSRMPVPGTVPVGYLKEDDAFYTGIVDNQYIGKNPLKIDAGTLKWGQTRFNTYCSPCHDRTGHGQGIVGQRSSWIPANLHEDRARGLADGELFDVITHGRRTMPPYRFQITERDRWAIVAYVRALQRTDAKVDDVPQELRQDLR